MSEDGINQAIMKSLFKQYKCLLDHLMSVIELSPHLYVCDIPCDMELWQVNEKYDSKSKDGPALGILFKIPGRLVGFLRGVEFLEFGFNPTEPMSVERKNLKSLNGSTNPTIVFMMNMVIDEKEVRVLLHESMEPVEFTENHKILIEHIEGIHFVEGVDLSVFNGGVDITDEL